ncbi:MAG: phage tail protein [Rhodothermales bacterium]
MAEPFLGEIIMFGGNFAPRGWASCDGQLEFISQNSALFSLLGTTFGGDGRTTFALPDLQGRVPVHAGGSAGPGLQEVRLGEKGGTENVTLTTQQIPSHTHAAMGTSDTAGTRDPTGALLAEAANPTYTADTSSLVNMDSQAVGNAGGGQQHTNVMPFLVIHFIIATLGTYPSRN